MSKRKQSTIKSYYNKHLIVLLILFHSIQVEGANILFFFGVSTYSHRLLATPLASSLADLGHNVTFLSPYTPPEDGNPKIHEFSPPALQEFFKDAFGSRSDFLKLRLDNNGNQAAWHQMLPGLATTVCDIILSSPESKGWIDSSSFDLIIIDALFNDCGLGLAWKFQAPHISFGTCTFFMWQPDAYGFPVETNWIPDASMDFPMEMSFSQRVSNTVRPVLWHLYRHFIMYPKLEAKFQSVFNTSDMPALADIERNASLVLQNVHYTLDYPRALPPLVVPVGGLHLTPLSNKTQKLPQDMKEFLDSSGENGFIFVSFGSVVQISKMPFEMKQAFISTFKSYSNKLKFLWKYESGHDDDNEKLPENIFPAKWVPQEAILRHKNIKGFITHGGILSIEESVQNQVPMIVMPVLADQEFNSENIVRRGLGLRVHFRDVNETTLKVAIDELLGNKKYKEGVIEVSKIFQDRPIAPLDEAIWWIEHVLRYPQSGKFRQPWSANQNWIERRSLDVWAYVGFIVIFTLGFIIALVLSIVNFIYKMLFKNKKDLKEKSEEGLVQSPVQIVPSFSDFDDEEEENENDNNNAIIVDDKCMSPTMSPKMEKKKNR